MHHLFKWLLSQLREFSETISLWKFQRILIVLLTTFLLSFLSYDTSHWIGVCVPFETGTQAMSLYHKDFPLANINSDIVHEMCFYMGIMSGSLSMPHIPQTSIYLVPFQHVFVLVTMWLFQISKIQLFAVLVFYVLSILTKNYLSYNKFRLICGITGLSAILQVIAIVLFTLYKETGGNIAYQQKMSEELFSNFRVSYGYSYFLSHLIFMLTLFVLAFNLNRLKEPSAYRFQKPFLL